MNFLAIIIAAIINMVLGALWYSPVLFAKPWMKLMGFEKNHLDKMKEGMGPKYAMMFVSSLVIAYILSLVITKFGVTTALDGAGVGFIAWLGFSTTTRFTNWAFSGKQKELYFLDTGYQLVAYSLMGALLAAWR